MRRGRRAEIRNKLTTGYVQVSTKIKRATDIVGYAAITWSRSLAA
jgi:hypothetical protein